MEPVQFRGWDGRVELGAVDLPATDLDDGLECVAIEGEDRAGVPPAGLEAAEEEIGRGADGLDGSAGGSGGGGCGGGRDGEPVEGVGYGAG